MMRPSLRTTLLALLAVAGPGCGGFGVSGDDGGDDDGDGGSCSMSISVEPLVPVPGDELQLTALVDEGDAVGFTEYRWTVVFSGDEIEIAGDGEQVVEFTAEGAGTYTVELAGSVGGQECLAGSRFINVVAEGAAAQAFRLRVVPSRSDSSLPPPQDTEIELYGGAEDYFVGSVDLLPGTEVTGVSRGIEGEPVPAYLRARPLVSPGSGPPLYSEVFAGDDGGYQMRLIDEDHELLVIPDDPALPPYRYHSIALAELAGVTQIKVADEIAVSVGSGAGGAAPVAGARVSIVVNGVPSSVAVTDGAGDAVLSIDPDRAAAAASLTIVPPEESGLPQLDLPASQGLELPAGSGAIEVRYLASLASRTIAPAVRMADGSTPAGGSRVTWIARPIAGAGTITIGTTSRPATGVVRRTAAVNAGGDMAATILTEALYDAVVEPPAGAPRATDAASVTEVDLTAGEPAPLALAAPARLRGQVVAPPARGDEGGAASPLAGVRVQATPRAGALLGAPSAGAAAITDGEGRFTLAVAAGGAYEVTADGIALREGRIRLHVTAPAPGAAQDLDVLELPRVLGAIGVVEMAGGGNPLPGTHLQLFCYACGPEDSAVPVAETVTDDAGRFVLIAPDPGIAPVE